LPALVFVVVGILLLLLDGVVIVLLDVELEVVMVEIVVVTGTLVTKGMILAKGYLDVATVRSD